MRILFKAEFERTISMSAVKTKFEQPSQKGQNMVATVRQSLDAAHQAASDRKAAAERGLKDTIARIEEIEKRLQDFSQGVKV